MVDLQLQCTWNLYNIPWNCHAVTALGAVSLWRCCSVAQTQIFLIESWETRAVCESCVEIILMNNSPSAPGAMRVGKCCWVKLCMHRDPLEQLWVQVQQIPAFPRGETHGGGLAVIILLLLCDLSLFCQHHCYSVVSGAWGDWVLLCIGDKSFWKGNRGSPVENIWYRGIDNRVNWR